MPRLDRLLARFPDVAGESKQGRHYFKQHLQHSLARSADRPAPGERWNEKRPMQLDAMCSAAPIGRCRTAESLPGLLKTREEATCVVLYLGIRMGHLAFDQLKIV